MKHNITYTFHQFPHPHEDDAWDSYILHPILVIPSPLEEPHGVQKTLNMLRRVEDYHEALHIVNQHIRFNVWIVNGTYLLPQKIINEAINLADGEATLCVYNDNERAITHHVRCDDVTTMHGIVNSLWRHDLKKG